MLITGILIMKEEYIFLYGGFFMQEKIDKLNDLIGKRVAINNFDDLKFLTETLDTLNSNVEDSFEIGFSEPELAEMCRRNSESCNARTGACIMRRALPILSKIDEVKDKVPRDFYFAMLWYAIRTAIRPCRKKYVEYMNTIDDVKVREVAEECIKSVQEMLDVSELK